MFEVTDMQKIGVGLAGFGISFIILGIILLFDKGLLAIGNILFLVGLGCVIGLQRTFRFFFQRHKAKASAAFFSGIFVVLLGWPFVGMILEIYGFVLLFSGFFPAAVNFLRRVPVLGTFLNFPGISMAKGRGYLWCLLLPWVRWPISVWLLFCIFHALDRTPLPMNDHLLFIPGYFVQFFIPFLAIVDLIIQILFLGT